MAKRFGTVEERRAYNRRHYRVAKARGKASAHTCPCGAPAAEWAQLHDKDGEDPDDYEAMCRKCHQRYDDRWNDQERARVSESLKKMWANSPGRKQAMREAPHRLRGR